MRWTQTLGRAATMGFHNQRETLLVFYVLKMRVRVPDRNLPLPVEPRTSRESSSLSCQAANRTIRFRATNPARLMVFCAPTVVTGSVDWGVSRISEVELGMRQS